MQELDDYLNRIEHLPPAPRILPELLRLLAKPDIDSSEVVRLLTFDPGLTASVLRQANSAFLGGTEPAANVQEAVTRLGFHPVLMLVASITGSSALSTPQTGYGLGTGELWKHSVTAALAAELMAKNQGDDENLVFTATLLHDLGKIVLSEALNDKYTRILEETELNRRSMGESEKLLLGVEHAEIGAQLLARWKFPASIVAAVCYHHDPAAAQPHQRLAAYVYMGNIIAHNLGYGSGYQSFALRARAEAFTILGLEADQWPRYLIRTLERVQAMSSLLNLKV